MLLFIDCETSGLEPKNNNILQLAWVNKSKDGFHSKCYYINHPHIDKITEDITKINGITIETIKEQGRIPQDVLIGFSFAVKEANFLAGHNIVRFDIPFIVEELRRYDFANEISILESKKVIDTAALFKAYILYESRKPNENLRDFYLRVLDMPVKGAKYNLDVCLQHFHLWEKYKKGREIHNAGTDAELSYIILKNLAIQPFIAGIFQDEFEIKQELAKIVQETT